MRIRKEIWTGGLFPAQVRRAELSSLKHSSSQQIRIWGNSQADAGHEDKAGKQDAPLPHPHWVPSKAIHSTWCDNMAHPHRVSSSTRPEYNACQHVASHPHRVSSSLPGSLYRGKRVALLQTVQRYTSVLRGSINEGHVTPVTLYVWLMLLQTVQRYTSALQGSIRAIVPAIIRSPCSWTHLCRHGSVNPFRSSTPTCQHHAPPPRGLAAACSRAWSRSCCRPRRQGCPSSGRSAA